MIDPKELRIGNWLRCNDLFIQVSGISAGSFTCTHLGLLYFNSEDCHPIDLSPEILYKCGFKKVQYQLETLVGYELWPYEWMRGNLSQYFDTDDYDPKFIIAENVKYLHQLQNIIFALTGEELQVNL